jgi:hypothetical protein
LREAKRNKKRRKRGKIEKKSVKGRVENIASDGSSRTLTKTKEAQRINRNTICNRRSFNLSLNCEKLESRRESHVFNLNPSLVLLKTANLLT